jgi:acetyltransferase-like isoleucine patch superfamily enzyme
MNALLNALRVTVLRLRGVRVGHGVQIGRNVSISPGVTIGDKVKISEGAVLQGNVRVGAKSWVQKFTEISGNVDIGRATVISAYSYLSTIPTASIVIGTDVLVNAYSVIGASDRVLIDDHCIFAAYVQITDASHGIRDSAKLTKHSEWERAAIHIHRNVWLGSGAMVTMGVEIGEGCVVGAKALVNRSLPAMSVAYGIPAKVVRTRDAKGIAGTP